MLDSFRFTSETAGLVTTIWFRCGCFFFLCIMFWKTTTINQLANKTSRKKKKPTHAIDIYSVYGQEGYLGKFCGVGDSCQSVAPTRVLPSHRVSATARYAQIPGAVGCGELIVAFARWRVVPATQPDATDRPQKRVPGSSQSTAAASELVRTRRVSLALRSQRSGRPGQSHVRSPAAVSSASRLVSKPRRLRIRDLSCRYLWAPEVPIHMSGFAPTCHLF